MFKILLSSLLLTATFQIIHSQSPVPPRLNIPGAIPIGGPVRPQFRNEKIVRVRRPNAQRAQNTLIPQVPQHILEDPKPVTESAEDHQPDVYLPQLLREQQLAQTQQAQFQQTAAAFFNSEPNDVSDAFPTLSPQLFTDAPALTSVQPTANSRQSQRPVFNDYGIGRFGNDRSQENVPAHSQNSPQQRTGFLRSRPQPRPQFEAQAAPAPVPVSRPRPKPIHARNLIDQNQLQDERDQAEIRRQQPVSQTIRKWSEENEDGSITWGYENDDGSFKEEIIGKDCVTKGTYGYIDPDGNKREYHYETGIKCDPNTRQSEEELQDSINYEDNRAYLPNGEEIDMSQLGKKKSKRPGANFRI